MHIYNSYTVMRKHVFSVEESAYKEKTIVKVRIKVYL